MNLIKRMFVAFYSVSRSLLGARGVCIYHVTCSEYAKITFKNKSFPVAIVLVTLRVLSCNPLTALFMNVKFYFEQKKRSKKLH